MSKAGEEERMEIAGTLEEVAEESAKKTLPEPSTEREEYEELCLLVNKIAQPLASRKIAKRLYKLIKKAAKSEKGNLKQGLTDIQKAIRKDEKGIIVLAGNVSPIDVYSHIPAMCEEKELPYVYTPSREHLGLASGHKVIPSSTLIMCIHNDATP